MKPRDPTIQWLTTAPNPDVRGYGADDGQRGWRTHAVPAEDSETFPEIAWRPSACGLIPNHGWGMDMFIERRCARCVRILGLPENREEYARRLVREAMGVTNTTQPSRTRRKRLTRR